MDLYTEAKRPYIEAPGAVPQSRLDQRSWRYILEINTTCNLSCAMCLAGNRDGYEYSHGPQLMDMGLLREVLTKITTENPKATICPYTNSEPFLHPQLPECIAEIKSHKLHCEVASNLNHVARVDDLFKAHPDYFSISVSGFTQSVYERAHRGGNIDKVKANMALIKEAADRVGRKGGIGVCYHKYNDNLDDVEPMLALTTKLGFDFLISWARTITIEPTVQALRHLDLQAGREVKPYCPSCGGLDLNQILPAASPVFIEAMKRLRFHPIQARDLYSRFPVVPICLASQMFSYVRHDGKIHLCPWTDHPALVLGNYLDMTQEQIIEARQDHPLCQECLQYRLNLYFHVVDAVHWDEMKNPYV